MKDNGGIVGGVDAIDVTIRGGFRAAKLALEQGIERPLDIERSERTSIVELNARMQVEDVSERIGNLPALRQSRLDVEMVVARQQRVEEKFVNALGLPVDAHSRVQIRGLLSIIMTSVLVSGGCEQERSGRSKAPTARKTASF